MRDVQKNFKDVYQRKLENAFNSTYNSPFDISVNKLVIIAVIVAAIMEVEI